MKYDLIPSIRKIGMLTSIGIVLFSFASSQSAERFTGYFEEIEEDRDLALQQSVLTVAGDALANLIGDENYNPQVRDCMAQWVIDEHAPRYRDLTSNVLFDLDQQVSDQWALEGSMRIEMGVLNRWVQQELNGDGCGAPVQRRRTIYVQSPANAGEQSEAISSILSYVEQNLMRNGYEVVDESRRQYAQFRLGVDNAEFSERGPVMGLNITGFYVDNRVDGQPFLSIASSVEERLRTTIPVLQNDLYERQSQAVLAQIREWEASYIVDEHEIELVFVSQSAVDFNTEDELLQQIMASFDLPEEFMDSPDALQLTNLDNDVVEISVLIPAQYGLTLGRSQKRELQSIADEILDFDVAASEFSNNATKLTIFDASTIVEEWEKAMWEYLDSGKLVFPIEGNAYAVIRSRLQSNPDDEKALGFVDEVIYRLVQRAISKIGQGALTSAGSDLAQAENIGQSRNFDTAPWEVARRELDAAIARQQQQATPVVLVENSNGATTGSAPLVIFPELETMATRGISIVQDQGILGITADTHGIKRIEVNGKEVNFNRVSETNRSYLVVPGAQAEEFYLPPSVTSGDAELRLTITDGNDEVTERRLVLQSDDYVLAENDPVAIQSSNDDDLLKEGASALDGNYFALIIANQDYQRVNDLATPVNDANALKDVLVQLYSFDASNVRMVVNGTKNDIELAIDNLQDDVGPNDSVLIYFAGHGFQDMGLGGTGYWIPTDGLNSNEQGHRTTWVSNTLVADYVEKLRARHVLLISDSCYSGTFAQRGNESDHYMATDDYIKRKAGKPSRRAITSGDIEPVLDGGGNGHSVFAYHMLEVLRAQAGNYVTGERLYQELFGPVLDSAPQTPQYFVMADNDDGGDFVFVPRGI